MTSQARRISIQVTGDPADAVRAFAQVSAAAQTAADEATAAGDRVAAAAVRQADTAAQAAARAADTAAAEAKAAADAFEEGNTAAYERAAQAAQVSADKAQAAWERSAAASAKAQDEAARMVGGDQEEASARAAAAAKASADAAQLQWNRASSSAEDAAKVAGDSAEKEAGRFGDAFDSGAKHVSNLFTGLGATLGNWGIPFGESLTKMGDKFAEAETSGQKFGVAMQNLGKIALVAGGGGFAVAAALGVKMAGDFQSAAEHLVTDAGETQSALKGVESGMLAISAATGTSAKAIVDGMYHVESAGFHGGAGLDVLRVAAEGAKVGGADLNTVAQTLVGTMRSYYGDTTNASNATARSTSLMNQLIAAVGAGDMRMQDLAGSLGNVTPVAAAAGLSFAQVGGAIATMTAQNMSAQQATQNLAHLIRALQAPNNVAVNEMQQLGISSNDVAKNLGKNGLTGTLQYLTQTVLEQMGPAGELLLKSFNQSKAAAGDLNTMLASMPEPVRKLADAYMSGTMTMSAFRKAVPTSDMGMIGEFTALYNKVHGFNDALKAGIPGSQTYNAAMVKLLGGATGLNVALMLTGKNLGDFQTNVATVGDAAARSGKNVDNWGEIQKTFNQQLDLFKTTVEDLGIRLGTMLIPILQKTMTFIAGVVEWFEHHKVAALALAAVIGGVVLTAITAYTVSMVAAAAATVVAAAPILAVIAAVAALGVGIYELATHWHQVWDDIKQWTADAWHYLDSVWQGIDDDLRPIFDAIKDFFIVWWYAIKALFEVWAATISTIVEVAWELIRAVTVTVWDGIKAFLEVWWDVVRGIVEIGWQAIETIFTVFLDLIEGKWSAAWGAIENFFSSTWSTIKGTAESVWNTIASFFTGAWGTFESTTASIWHTIVAGITGAWDGLKSSAVGVWDTVKGAFTSGVNDVIGIVNGFIGLLNHIPFVHIPNIPTVGSSGGSAAAPGPAPGATTPLPAGVQGPVAHAAAGATIGPGFMTKGPQVVVGEGRQAFPEFVIPTDPQHRGNAHTLLAALLEHIGMPKMSGGGIIGTLGSILGSITGAITGPVIDGAESAADGLLSHLGFPVQQLGDWAVSSLASAAKGMLGGGGKGSPVAAAGGTVSAQFAQYQQLGQQLAAAYGWGSGNEWVALNNVAMRESGWNPAAQNPSSSAYGIAQNIAGPGGYPDPSPKGQIEWMLQYIKSRYGDPMKAWAHELSAGWYDGGGVLRPGATLAVNTTGSDEYVFTAAQARQMIGAQLPGVNVPGGGGQTPPVNFVRQVVVQSDVSNQTIAKLNALLDSHDRELIRQLQVI